MYLVDHGEVAREIERGGAVDHDEIMHMYFGDRNAP
jgi:branched-chain amino acid transport system ATP-binding protein